MSGEYSLHVESGLTVKALVFDKIRSKLWTGSGFESITSIADADWADGAIICTEQSTDDSTGTGVYVGDRPSGITTSGVYLVEFYEDTPSPGDQHIGIQLDECGLGPVSQAVTATSLKVEVADYLGYGRNSEGAGDGWSTEEEARLDACILAGRRQFYWPPPLTGTAHRWSFLRPVASLTTVAEQEDYTLPSDFGGLIGGQLHFDAGDNIWTSIEEIGEGAMLNYRSLDYSVGTPRYAAIVPNDSDGSSAQTWTLQLFPAPNEEFTIKYRYQIVPESVGSAYNLGGDAHYETLVASCLAAAERKYRDGETVQQAYWQERLAASIAFDRKMGPLNYGYNGDATSVSPLDMRDLLRTQLGRVTYNGTYYTGV